MNNLNSLKELQENLAGKYPHFPTNCCSTSAKEVYNKFGFSPVSGFVLTSKGAKEHSWNVTPDGRVIDLTLYQFRDFYDKKIGKIINISGKNSYSSYGYFEDEDKTSTLKNCILSLDNKVNFF